MIGEWALKIDEFWILQQNWKAFANLYHPWPSHTLICCAQHLLIVGIWLKLCSGIQGYRSQKRIPEVQVQQFVIYKVQKAQQQKFHHENSFLFFA